MSINDNNTCLNYIKFGTRIKRQFNNYYITQYITAIKQNTPQKLYTIYVFDHKDKNKTFQIYPSPEYV